MHYYEILILETIGWLGSILFIGAYFLLSSRIIKKDSLYYMFNIIGALFILTVSIYKNTMQPIILNLFWIYFSYVAYKKNVFKYTLINVKLFNILIFSALFFSFISLILTQYSLTLDILAWTSVFTFVTSYYLYSTHKIELHQFNIYNFIAPLTLIPKMYVFENYQVVVLEVVWV
ncbi:MAG: hypothetical protein JJV94_07895, partial [Sulfurospirillum sp.]|nr:hypothetical protein [Sulfurospirillum sp.]